MILDESLRVIQEAMIRDLDTKVAVEVLIVAGGVEEGLLALDLNVSCVGKLVTWYKRVLIGLMKNFPVFLMIRVHQSLSTIIVLIIKMVWQFTTVLVQCINTVISNLLHQHVLGITIEVN